MDDLCIIDDPNLRDVYVAKKEPLLCVDGAETEDSKRTTTCHPGIRMSWRSQHTEVSRMATHPNHPIFVKIGLLMINLHQL